MSAANKALALEVLERGFNQGDLSVFDTHLAAHAVDHQEPPGTDFRSHIKTVVVAMRSAFPDLHFEVQHIVAEGDIVAFHSTMTGTHTAPFALGPFRELPISPNKVSVRHMHFVRIEEGKTTDLWHLWDTASMLRQLGATPAPQPSSPSV